MVYKISFNILIDVNHIFFNIFSPIFNILVLLKFEIFLFSLFSIIFIF